jgi:hypothetical protein
MSDFTARPRYTLPFAGKEYDLVGTMEMIEAAEYAVGRSIIKIVVGLIDELSARDLAKLLSAILTANDHKTSVAEVSGLLWNTVGLAGDANTLLRLHLYGFLSICLAPPETRREKATQVGELLKGFPGGSIRKPASES